MPRAIRKEDVRSFVKESMRTELDEAYVQDKRLIRCEFDEFARICAAGDFIKSRQVARREWDAMASRGDVVRDAYGRTFLVLSAFGYPEHIHTHTHTYTHMPQAEGATE